ncbi:heparin lyase I family protein [Candidatus Pelagibacter sp.]|nr:heparin lyase I family protein [Candidatus Pelagibacter sp.]
MKKIYLILFLITFGFNLAYADKDITNLKWKPSVYKGKVGKSYEIVKAEKGEPTIGKKAFKFIAIPFDCGSEGAWYSDCGNSYTSKYDTNKKIGGGDRVRSELTSGWNKATRFNKGKFWVSFSIYIPKDYQTISPTVTSMFQIFESGKGPNLKIEDHYGWLTGTIKVKGKEVKLFKDYDKNFSQSDVTYSDETGKPKLIKIEDMRGKWTNFKIHTRASNKKDKGFYKFYVNEILVAEYKGRTSGTAAKGLGLKAGIYQTGISRSLMLWEMPKKWEPRQDPGKFPTQIIYMDNIFKAKKEEKLIKLIKKAK